MYGAIEGRGERGIWACVFEELFYDVRRHGFQ